MLWEVEIDGRSACHQYWKHMSMFPHENDSLFVSPGQASCSKGFVPWGKLLGERPLRASQQKRRECTEGPQRLVDEQPSLSHQPLRWEKCSITSQKGSELATWQTVFFYRWRG